MLYRTYNHSLASRTCTRETTYTASLEDRLSFCNSSEAILPERPSMATNMHVWFRSLNVIMSAFALLELSRLRWRGHMQERLRRILKASCCCLISPLFYFWMNKTFETFDALYRIRTWCYFFTTSIMYLFSVTLCRQIFGFAILCIIMYPFLKSFKKLNYRLNVTVETSKACSYRHLYSGKATCFKRHWKNLL